MSLSGAIQINEIAAGLPRRIHGVTADPALNNPHQIALVEDGATWSYLELDQRAAEIVARREVSVETAMRQLGGFHQFSDTDARQPGLFELQRRCVEYGLMVLRLIA